MCPKTRSDGFVVVREHVERWVEMSYNQREVQLLAQKHNISFLYAKFIHEQEHCGVSATASKVRVRSG